MAVANTALWEGWGKGMEEEKEGGKGWPFSTFQEWLGRRKILGSGGLGEDLIFVIFAPQMYFWAQFFST